jgi:hypothetical protein
MILHNLDVAIALAVVMLAVSLLITIFTQAVSTGLATRGQTLRVALTELFKAAYPDGAAHAEEIARDVLTHKLISDSVLPESLKSTPVLRAYRYASAVRVEEVIGILEALAPAPAQANAPPPAPAQGNAPPAPNQGPSKEEAMRALVRRARETMTPQIHAATQEAAAWFNSAMDRASQQFVLKTRLITVVLSIIVAFALHLDTFRLLSQVSGDPELRAGLVNAAQAMQTQAAAVLKASPSGNTQAAAAGNASNGNKNLPAEELAIHVPQAYADALKATLNKFNDKSPERPKTAGELPGRITSREAGERWLRSKMGNDANVGNAVAGYQLAVDQALKSDMDRLLDHAASIRDGLDNAGFQLVPNPYHGWDFWPSTKGWFGPWSNLHFWGIVFSAGLLSLGAPFWYNALKTLSSLRPVVASKAEREQQSG